MPLAFALICFPLPSPILPSSSAAVALAFLLASFLARLLVPSHSSPYHSSSASFSSSSSAVGAAVGVAARARLRAESEPPVSSVLDLRFARRAAEAERV